MTKSLSIIVVLLLLIITGAIILFLFIGLYPVTNLNNLFIKNSIVESEKAESDIQLKVPNSNIVLGDSYLIEDSNISDFIPILDNVYYESEEFYESDDPEQGGGRRRERLNECRVNSECEKDYYSDNYCYNGDVYRKFHEFSCSRGNCDDDTRKELVDKCVNGCNNGKCFEIYQCSDNKDNDNDSLVDDKDPGCWDDLSNLYSYNPNLNDENRGNILCFSDIDCGTNDYSGSKFCNIGENNVYQKYNYYKCENPGTGTSSCTLKQEDKIINECFSNQICFDGMCKDLMINCYNDNDCKDNNSLTKDICVKPGTEESFCYFENIQCNYNIDCGTDVYVGDKFCKNDDVYQKYKQFSCLDPGNSSSSCSYDTTDKIIEDCNHGCFEGKCKLDSIPSIKIISPLNNAVLTNDDILVKFETTNWNVGGKGENHVHFHIDNLPGLSFSEHLMFYNGNDKIVELNLEEGETIFASWIDENIVRLNKVPDGMHKIRAHLATVSHVPPGNPEAIHEIIVNVQANTCIDNDGDGYGKNCNKGNDCNDNDKDINPDADEVCDNKDNDCDGDIDESNDICETGSVCVLGTCQKINCYKNSDCGNDGFVGDEFCKVNDVYRNFISYECINPGNVNSNCVQKSEDKKIEACPSDNACFNGDCLPVTCTYNSDCGTTDFVGEKFCKQGDVYQNYKKYMCNNSGSAVSICSTDVEVKLVNDCQNGCYNGMCITEICNNGIDDDKDGLIDDLKELDLNNGEIFTAGKRSDSRNDPELVIKVLSEKITIKKFIYNIPLEPVLLSNNAADDYKWNIGDPSTETLDTVCKIFGYSDSKSYECLDEERSDRYPYGKCNFHSPYNNYLWRFNGNDFVKESAEPKYSKVWISSIVCKNRLPDCSDGWDNDGDGKIDEFDDGCASSTDDSEIGHDPECRYV